ncbi:helix-turn-helix transcriptional regulator [Brevundimonas diminuta]|uniref:helix-turn-helix domain-containing protein n=1 Tax=Brevundimonas TaxID=41275 RepID=UPI00190821AA|nr:MULTISPECIES: helix-turn-helix transcriptional regulator [Brevundimonas]MBK1976173.1 helix-turn-helix transcriptional regulator [Brevundimonas diminuta]
MPNPSNTLPFSSDLRRDRLGKPQPRQLYPSDFTERQLECLAWVQEGKSASDIGGILGISSRTVEGHLLKVCDRLGVKTRLQAVLKARDLGLIGPPVP